METAVLSASSFFVGRALRKSVSSPWHPFRMCWELWAALVDDWSCQCHPGGAAQWVISNSDSGKLLEDATPNIYWMQLLV